MPRDPAYRPKCRTCNRSRRSDRLLCPRCWNLVPADVQGAVYRTWQRGSLRQSDEYFAAVDAAIAAASDALAAHDQPRRTGDGDTNQQHDERN